jgi:translocation and assembly module TamB
MKFRRFLLVMPAAVSLTAAIAWFWLLHTESGAQWIWGKTRNAAPDVLDAQSVEGTLSNGLQLRGVVFDSESLSITVGSAFIAIDMDIFPLSLEVETLLVDSILVELSETGEQLDEEKSSVRDLLRDLAAPISVDISQLQISRGTIVGLTEDRQIDIHEIRLVGHWKDQIRIDQLHIAANEGSVDAVASIELRKPFDLNLASQVRLAPTAFDISDITGVDISIAGSLDSASISVDMLGVEGHLRGTLDNLLDLPAWNLSADVKAFLQPIDEERNLRIGNLSLLSAGNINNYTFGADFDAETSGFESLSVSAIGSGTEESIHFSSLEVNGTSISLSATGSAGWTEPRHVTADIELHRLLPNAWLSNWDDSNQVTGKLSLMLTEKRVLVEGAAFKVVGADADLKFDANIETESGIVEAEVAWSDLQWPITAATPQVSSNLGSVSLAGTLDDWQVSGKAAVNAAGVPSGDFAIIGGGNRVGLSLRIEEGKVLGGSVEGQIAYSWIDNQSLSAELELEEISIGPLAPEWPGVISGGISVEGQVTPLALQVSLDEWSGNLRGKPLSASGEIGFDDGEVLAKALDIVHGASTLWLDGSPYSADGIAYKLQLDNLGGYLDEYYGSVNASGRLSLAANDTYLRIDAASEELGFGDYRMRDIRIIDQQSATHINNTEITISEISAFNQIINDFSLQTSITEEEQKVSLVASSQDLKLELGISGAFEDWHRANELPWTGALDVLSISDKDAGKISLLEPAHLVLSAQSTKIGQFCLAGQTETYFCGEGSSLASGAAKTRLEFIDIPFALINVFTDTGFNFDQLLAGTFAWSQSANSRATGNAEIRLSPGSFRDSIGSEIVVETGPGMLAFDIRDGKLLAGTVNLPMPGTGNIAGHFSVLDVSDGTQSSIAGNLAIALSDLNVAAAFTPLVDEASGVLDVELALSGTLDDPVLTGKYGIVDGKLTYLPLGLKLDDLQIDGDLYPDQSMELTGHFMAGEGRADISTRADYRETTATGLELVLRGENLTVIDVPDVHAVANTDLQVSYDGETLNLNGSIFFPRASITPHNLSASRVSVSSDVVVIAGKLPGEEESLENDGNLRVMGELEVGLGDDVGIDLDLAKAALQGTANFVWSGDPVPMASGRYDLTGDVQAFGQVLNISEGVIRFANVPANNPSIRIRAEREIYGNSQIKRAGILIAGNARRQTIEPYTYPLTNEERALTLLVTGSDFDYEQGIGAVDFGTYIAPKLFVSYGIGLFDNENIISARYDLAKGFGVKATSGQKSSGFDFIYRIER